jgi:hypothetical protein
MDSVMNFMDFTLPQALTLAAIFMQVMLPSMPPSMLPSMLPSIHVFVTALTLVVTGVHPEHKEDKTHEEDDPTKAYANERACIQRGVGARSVALGGRR